MEKLKYKRILLKLTGEAMSGEGKHGINHPLVAEIAEEIREVKELGVEISIVIGGGNIFRGAAASTAGMERVTADHIGMLATIINGLALQHAMEKIGINTRVLTAIEIPRFAEPYVRRRALRHLEKGRIVIFAGGTGNPYFSTDTAASLRAVEMNAEVILKATKVDGVYDADPNKDRNAKHIPEISYLDILKKGIQVMDSTAISLCMDNKIPIIVFNLGEKGNINRIVSGEKIGTLVNSGE